MTAESAGSLKGTFEFELPDGTHEEYCESFTLPRVPAEGGPELLSRQLCAEIDKELRLGGYWDALTDFEELRRNARHTITADQMVTGREFSIHNTREVWREITNTLSALKLRLAEARAFKDVRDGLSDAKENELGNAHLNMVESFDRAVYLLAKIEDLFLLILFVNLWTTSSRIVGVDVSKPDWNKSIRWEAVKEGLADRSRLPADVTDAEYSDIVKVFDSYQRGGALERVAHYRNRITHRVHPSIDDPKFSASICFPKQLPSGGVDMTITWPTRAEFQFLELYADAAEAFSSVVTLLTDLKRIPRFA